MKNLKDIALIVLGIIGLIFALGVVFLVFYYQVTPM